MGFRNGAYATVWEVSPISPTMTKGRISISRKDRTTDKYVQDFGGFVVFIGSVAATKALGLKEKDRIRLGDVDVSNSYDKVKKVAYTDFKIFSFEPAEGSGGGSAPDSGGDDFVTPQGDVEESMLPW